MQRIDQASSTNHRSPVLIIMKHRDVHLLFQALLDNKAFRGFDVFQINTTKRWFHQFNRATELIRVLSIKLNIDAVDVGKPLEQHGLALHNWFAAQRPKIAKSKNRSPVGNHRNKIAFVGIIIGKFTIGSDRLTRDRNTR